MTDFEDYLSNSIVIHDNTKLSFIFYDLDTRLNKPINSLYLYATYPKRKGQTACRLTFKNRGQHIKYLTLFINRAIKDDLDVELFRDWITYEFEEGKVPEYFINLVNMASDIRLNMENLEEE